MRRLNPILCALTLGLASLTLARPAEAQNQGFTINRYDPTPAGEWSFWVDHPWYSRTRYFAGGITLNYAHDPLVFGVVNGNGFTQQQQVIEHQLIGHVDLAFSFLDRVTINASLPITFLETGTARWLCTARLPSVTITRALLKTASPAVCLKVGS